MKTKSLMIVVLMIFAASSVYAATLSFNPKGGGIVDINVDQAQGIAGAAFTIKYDTTSLTLSDVTSAFFETFAVQKQKAGSTWTSAIPTDLGYDQPLIDNTITGTGTAISAARFKGADTATNATLFTLTFQRKTGITATNFPISIVATSLNNTSAGYSASGETINLLIGADASVTDLTSASAFPVILAKNTDSNYVFASGNATFNTWNLDADGNGSVDGLTDGLLILRYLLNTSDAILIKNSIGQGATRITAAAIKEYLNTGKTNLALDVDGNGSVDGLTDGLLVLRYLLNTSDAILIKNSVGQGATRTTATAIKAYIQQIKP